MAGKPGKHSKGKHRGRRPLRTTLRTTGGLVAGVTVIGLAAGGARVAWAETGASSKWPGTLAAVAPDAEVVVPASADIAGKSKDAKGTSGRAINAGRGAKDRPRVPQQRQAGAAKPKAAQPAPAKKKPTADDAIKLAKKQVGITENRSGGGTKFQDWYVKAVRAKKAPGSANPKVYANAAWCSMFISWVGDHLGFSDQLGADAYTVTHARWFQKEHRWGKKPKPGAIVFFAWNGGKSVSSIEHVGMVVKDEGHGKIQTVEGNTSNAVRVRERSTSSVVGYGYPDYAKN